MAAVEISAEIAEAGSAPHVISTDPNTGEVLGAVPITGADEVRRVVARARAAQLAWAARPLHERMAIMRGVGQELVGQARAIADICARESGKSESEALVGDVLVSLLSLKGYLRVAPRVLRTRRQRQGLLHATKRTLIVHEPLGVVAVISPFNYPVLLSLQAVFAALLAGNAVVHKPSEWTPLTALRVRDAFYAAGVPQAVFQVVAGGRETGQALVNADVNHVAFVGSSQVGREVARCTGGRLIPVTMELGGNNAMLVLDDAPIERAVHAAAMWTVLTNGQVCGSVARIYVHASVAPAFIERLQVRLDELRAGTEVRGGRSDLTALVSEDAIRKVEQRVADAVKAGAHVLAGGRRLAGTTAPVYLPTLLVNVQPNMEIMREETFGPVCTVTPVHDDEEALRLANGTAYGLTASVWTRDKQRAWKLARRLDVGSVAVNDHMWPFFAPEAPWGGIKGSGLGRVGGEWGLRAMTYPKAISFDRLVATQEPYWYPLPKWVHAAAPHLLPLLFAGKPVARLRALAALVHAVRRRGSS